MTGLFLLFIAGVWFFFAWRITIFLTRKMRSRLLTTIIECTLFSILLVAPIADEIIGKIQFDKLCQESTPIQVDRVKAAGKTVYLADLSNIQIEGTLVPIRLQPWRYVDATTGELVVSYNILYAMGGKLTRMLKISEGDTPLIFSSACAPNKDDRIKIFKELGITKIKRPQKNSGEKK